MGQSVSIGHGGRVRVVKRRSRNEEAGGSRSDDGMGMGGGCADTEDAKARNTKTKLHHEHTMCGQGQVESLCKMPRMTAIMGEHRSLSYRST